MKKEIRGLLAATTMALVLPVWTESQAMVGRDPILPAACTITQATAQLGPDGTVRYNLMGSCGGAPITGQMAYAPNHQMKEKFSYQGTEFSTSAMCPSDPWTTGAACQDQQVTATGFDPGHLINMQVPLSMRVLNAPVTFQQARANAVLPRPPGAPVNAKAITRANNRAIVSWLGPDQQGNNGPYLDFVVEARPQQAAGAAWVHLGVTPRHPAPDYQLTVQLPPPVKGTAGWELRACSTTALTRTCTGPFIAAAPIITDPAQAKKNMDLMTPGSQRQRILRKSDALTPSVSTPESSQKPAPGQTNALNPQPLPPKALSPGIIMRRGVEEQTLPAEQHNAAPKEESASTEAKP